MKNNWSCLFCFVFLVSSAALAVAQTDAPAPAAAVLLIGDNAGIPDADARTAAMLVYDELRNQGISVSEPVREAPASANVYRIVMRPLGTKIFVRLSEESPVGTITAERQITLAGIEEMISAAPRLVDALVHNKPIASTVDMTTVTEEEARVLRKVTGDSLFNIGFFAAFIPGTDVSGVPGYRFGWSYEMPSYAVEIGGRIVSNEGDGYAAFSTGGLYFLNRQTISPFVGGGITAANAWTGSGDWEIDDEERERGTGIYAVGGIQMLRHTRNRLKFELRVDRPLFSLPSNDIMPITVGLFYSRQSGGCLF